MGALLVVTWLSLGTGDAVSTHVALSRGAAEGNRLLPQNAWAIDGVRVGVSVGGGLAARHLWTHGHRKAAIGVTLGFALLEGWAVAHNVGVAQRQPGR